MSSNQVLMDRILGQGKYNQEDSFERLGSGRGLMMLASFKIYEDSNTFEKLFGLGVTEQKSRMKLEIGNGLVPHNGFLYLLLTNGILGLFLFLWFLRKVWKNIVKLTGGYKAISMSCFSAYLVMTFVQNFNMVYGFIIFLIVVIYAVKTDRNLVL